MTPFWLGVLVGASCVAALLLVVVGLTVGWSTVRPGTAAYRGMERV